MLVPGEQFYSPSVWADYAPGEEANYTNYGMIILEHIIEKITNKKFHDYCNENIFKPLEMDNTSFYFKDFNRNQLAFPYQKFAGIFLKIPLIDQPYGVGGLKTSSEDLSHYLTAHLNCGKYNGIKILNESTIKIMHSIQYPNSSLCKGNQRYGLGWVHWMPLSEDEFEYEGHAGNAFGGTAWMMMNKTERIGIIIFTNTFIFFSKDRVASAIDEIMNDIFKRAEGY
jgi:CubicO group peptidase (beta-lactamase class C family)